MSIQFVLGGSGCGKTYFMQHYFLREAKLFPSRQYIFLVPEQFTMQTQKELVSLSEDGGIMNIDVQSFVRLAFRIFSETGANRMPVLDDMGKTMILKKLLSGMEDKLSYFGKNVEKSGYVQEIKSFLSELYQYHVTEEKLDDMIKAAEDRPLLVRKLQDMKTVYREFSEYLKEHYITSEEVMDVLARVTEESEILMDSIVCLDGFTGFTPTQYEFLRRLIRVAKKVYITVTMDERESIVSPGPKHGLFYLSRKTLYRIRKIAGEYGVEVCEEIWTGRKKEETRFFHEEAAILKADNAQKSEGKVYRKYFAEGIAFLERELFRFPIKQKKGAPKDISIHVLENPEKEMQLVIEKIRTLLYEEKCRYRDIAVVTGDLKTYGMLAKDAFLKAGIPCFVDQKKGIEEHPFVELIQSVIEIFLSNFRMEKVMQFEKNMFSLATKEQSDFLDNFLRASGIYGYKKWQEVWDESILSREMEQKEKEKLHLFLDTIRVEVLDQIGELYEKIGKGKHTVRKFSQAFCEWMEEEGYYFKIEKQVEKFEEQKEKALAWEYRQIYEIVLGVFDKLVELLGEEKMSLKEFREILGTGFSEARIGLIPPGIDQVLVGDMNRSRLAHIKHLFFIGVNDGIIPQAAGKGGVISDAERQFLSDEEFELAPTLRESIYTEQFYLYLNLTKPDTHLYLTYHETGTDGNAKKPSYIIDRILRMFPDLKPVVEENRTDDSYLLGNFFGRDYLIGGLRKKNFSEQKWKEIFRFYKADEERKKQLSDWVSAAFYRENQKALSKEAVHELYHEVLSGSTSQFEQYAACAFAYFMRYGLHLKERKEHQVAFFDIGNIAHAALEQYTKDMLSEKKNWTDFDEEEQKRRVDRCVEAVVPDYKNGLLLQTERDSYLISRLKRIVGRTVWAITKQMEAGNFQTVRSEFGFEVLEGRKGEEAERKVSEPFAEESDPIRVYDFDEEGNEVLEDRMEKQGEEKREALEQDGLLRLIGRIDRIDGMEDEERAYLSVVDYKTGKKDLSLSELYHGLQLQLMIYLKAGMETKQEKTKKLVIPAGILYYHVADPMVNKKAGESKEEMELRILKELRMGGFLNMDEPVLSSFDKSFQGENGELPASIDSHIFSMGTTSKGALKKTSKTLTTEDFSLLLDFTEKKLREIHAEIMDGNMKAEPFRDSAGGACAYCPYHAVCRFDVRIPGNHYKDIENLSDDDVMERISKDLSESGE
ncbi:MAG: exodeoxyribonuclease V subunit gamma [Lachnospiraceae bacterium]|nr:exodeoxyribonuclease V subunit gamma [Lachnospiraceae bacterium]